MFHSRMPKTKKVSAETKARRKKAYRERLRLQQLDDSAKPIHAIPIHKDKVLSSGRNIHVPPVGCCQNGVSLRNCTSVNATEISLANTCTAETSFGESPSVNTVVIPKENPRPTVQGSFHQAIPEFGSNAGRQCVPNCLAAASFHHLKTVNDWESSDMDHILKTGNELYSYLQASTTINQPYILINELPTELEIFQQLLTFSYRESLATVVGNEHEIEHLQEFNASPLYETLQMALTDCNVCFVCFSENTILVGRRKGGFFIFDSHSRSHKGLLHVDGRSVCMLFKDIDDVYTHIQELAISMRIGKAVECEVTGVIVLDSQQHQEGSDDVQFVSMTSMPPAFAPLTVDIQRRLCDQLSVPFHVAMADVKPCETAGKPEICHEIESDGNCFYRAISFAVSNTESNHMEIRKLVCNFALREKAMMQSALRPQFESVESYIRTSCIECDGTWATEFEILCSACLLHTDIYTFSGGKWLTHSARQLAQDQNILQHAIYLDHAGQCHYNVVLSTTNEEDDLPSHERKPINISPDVKRNGDDNETKTDHRSKSKYNLDPEYRERIKARARAYQQKRYATDNVYRQTKKDLARNQSKRKYATDEKFKEDVLKARKEKYNKFKGKVKEKRKERYMADEIFKEKAKDYSKKKYSTDATFKQKVKKENKEKSKQKYMTDEQFKEKAKQKSKKKYNADATFKQKVKKENKEKSKEKYMTDEQFKEKAKQKSIKKYNADAAFKQKVKKENKEKSKVKYMTDEKFKNKAKQKSKHKYMTDEEFKKKAKQKSIKKYKTNEKFKEMVKMRSKQKYKTDAKFKENVKFASKFKYRADKRHKERVVTRLKKKYNLIIDKNPAMRQIYAKRKLKLREHKKMKNIGTKNVISFREKASKGPVCTCACCTRLLFETQVQVFQDDSYGRKGKKIAENARLSISNKVWQICKRSKLWICKTCHKKLLKGDLPSESTMNSLELEDIPEELKILNNLEQHLVALHIPFMKVVALPKGGQKAIHGPVVCVPSNMRKTTSLPRGEDSDLILRVKLKRKLSYKGYYEYQFVNTSNVQTALEYLKRNNRWYSSIEMLNTKNIIRDDEVSTDVDLQARVKKEVKALQENPGQHFENQSTTNVDTEVSDNEQEENGVQYDTCLQPADVGQEVLDHYFDDIYSLAPAEGMNPVRLLQEHGNEAKSFPVLFPSGRNTFDEKRSLQLSLCRYFNTRLMNADNRFARDTNYIFYSQYLSELKQVIDKTQISLRKSSTSSKDNTDKVTSESLKTASDLKLLIRNDEALRFLQPIRGTPSYWQGAQKDLFAMLRQLGIPTWFCSFSAAEFRWNDIIDVILKQQKDSRQAETLDWTEKSKVLKSNPVTVARMFDHRFHIFLRQVILSSANPIGCVSDYFYRVEFQQRGSPHMHCLFWVKNAPKLSDDGCDAVCAFIDKYVTCKLPSKSDDSELNEIVSSVQQHSKNHSKSCKKKGTMCRFNFPRPPSEKTFIVSPIEMEEENQHNYSTAGSASSPNHKSDEGSTTMPIKREDENQQKNTTHASVGSSHNKSDEGSTAMMTLREEEEQKDTTLESLGYCHSKSHHMSTAKTTLKEEEQKYTTTESVVCSHEKENENTKMTKQEAVNLLASVWDAVLTLETLCTKTLFRKLGIDQLKYEEAHKLLTTRQSVILKRDPSEIWVNQYNPHLLRCWDANMDIQFVLDPFSCIVYIISYISKSEREMGMLLRQTKLEAEEGNMNARQTMKAIGSAYLHHREVGVQEAVYRVCGLHMKEFSRKVQFIPVGENPTRLTKPLSQITKNKSKCNDKRNCVGKHAVDDNIKDDDDGDDDIWMTNIVERYESRPNLPEFEKLCLAEFCSDYRVIYKSQIPNGKTREKVYELRNDKGYIQKRSRTKPAIIRYPRFNESKQPEEYYQTMLQLFLPYWTRTQLKPPKFELYRSFYESGFVQYKGDEGLCKVMEVVERNRCQYIAHEKDIEDAQEYFATYGAPEDAWARLCPETELERHECQLKKPDISNVDNDEEKIVDLDNGASNSTSVPYYVTRSETTREEILPVLRSLNKEQTQAFYFVRDWCLKRAQGHDPDPFHIFITGGAGTGKSHLIKAVEYEASRLLAKSCTVPDKQTVILTAFTGTAAFNIGGCTIHHAFKFNRGFPIPYDPLKEQALNPLRVELDELQILIIDEISMVYKRLLYYIHERLVQIKKSKRPFGGVSVIAVGDFFQLPPVKQSKSERLYMDSGSYPIDFWKDHFSIVILSEIMRQREDHSFAEMLNTIRTRTSDMPLQTEVRDMLSECTREGPPDVLHVYATNKEVNDYNKTMLESNCSDIKKVLANDFKKDRTTGKLKKMTEPTSAADTDSLPASLSLAKGAKVMLTRNIDVTDGLVNGAIGRVTDFVGKEPATLEAIEVKFDSRKIGKKEGIECKDGYRVRIKRVEDEIRKCRTVRHQFPLKLSWACTAHKVQGMTTDKVVVNLDNIFSPGQAYVALSRVTSKDGLYIDISEGKDIESKIYGDKEVESAIKNMPRLFENATGDAVTPRSQYCEVILFNAQSLHRNVGEIRADRRFHSADIICLTETWLQKGDRVSGHDINGFTLHQKTREDSYDENSELMATLRGNRGGGVAIYSKESMAIEIEEIPVKNIEGMMCKICNGKYRLILIYRPSMYTTAHFMKNLVCLVQHVSHLKDVEGTIFMGDFNENVLTTKGAISLLMERHGLKQKISAATTEAGTLLDHIYTYGNVHGAFSVMPTYYSFHEAIVCKLTL